MKRRLLLLTTAVLAMGCSAVGDRSGTEEPKHETITRHGAVEIRQYAPHLAAETTETGLEEDARTSGFRRLASFIFGDNQGKREIRMIAPVAQAVAQAVAQPRAEKIAMTAPVTAQAAGAGQWRIRFYMPAEYTADTLPAPNDPAIQIVTMPSETLAVLRFSGSRSATAMAQKRAELLAALPATGWISDGDPVDMFYDPPWTIPALRRNEVAVRVRTN